MRIPIFVLLFVALGGAAGAQSSPNSIAREWNEVYLTAIRNDFARPVVHARNLYHVSAAMYDAWVLTHREGNLALVTDTAGLVTYPDPGAAAEEAISYAAYRLLLHRYAAAPGLDTIRQLADRLMDALDYPTDYTSATYTNGRPAALGNHIAAQIIAYGRTDGANEALDYANDAYPDPVNPPLFLANPFSILNLADPNHWQPLAFEGTVIDQSGQVIGNIPGFLGASWGRVTPFALPRSARTDPSSSRPIYGNSPVYHDPGPPPYFSTTDTAELNLYRWNFETTLKWSSHLDPTDGVSWNISPGARGNLSEPLPETAAEYRAWYDEREGGQPGTGHSVNPITGQPYPDNIVPRGDYTRVLAEFWADGPQSETPPGHWFAIFNQVMDHPLFRRDLWGEGEQLSPLEYEVKAYLTLGGAMHDAAITAWSIKGKYDYVRPITAIRYLATRGQASVVDHRFYDPLGLRLDPGYIELVGSASEVVTPTTLMTVKARAWVGNSFINDPDLEQAGVDWINPSLWEPYQRPNFVTPNFAGYISGHSTFSAAAATVLEALTGTPYFPGGVGEFVAKQNEFLVFEEGPSVDVVLQWATYHDAAAETSLSRIWGGIHPPADDIPGRRIGRVVGMDAQQRARKLFAGLATSVQVPVEDRPFASVYPNPVPQAGVLSVSGPTEGELQLLNVLGQAVVRVPTAPQGVTRLPVRGLAPGTYFLRSSRGGQATRVVVR